jgi:DNA repair exonuclease SbcCD ATPase subunit
VSSGSAQVHSIAALKEFREGLCDFRQDAKEALCTTELAVRHFQDWLEDQQRHWRNEVRVCEELVVRAKMELEQRKYSHADRRGYTEQELALRKATARLEYARDKVEKVAHWRNVLPRAILEYQGPARQLGGMLDADLVRGLALLERKIEALEAYVAIGPGGTAPEPAAATEAEPQTAADAEAQTPGS